MATKAELEASLIEARREIATLRVMLNNAESEAADACFELEKQPDASKLISELNDAMYCTAGHAWRDDPREPYRSIEEVLRAWS